ncbi:MAG: hypothetical protein SPI30_02955 [Prevotella sp.]|nr:hypothetical protein [Prevotella sp.]
MRMILHGMDTSRWYGVYQRPVRFVPVLGSVSTNHWYDAKAFPYCFPKTSRGSATCGLCNSKSFIRDCVFSLTDKFTNTYNSPNSG